jgi:spore germination protein KC/spore germination protein
MIIAKGKGYDLLNATPHFERFSSEVVRELSQSTESLDIKMKHIAAALIDEGIDPIIPYMAPKKNEKGLDKKEEVENLGLALFQGDRMVGVAGPREMFGISWFHEKVANYTDTVKVENGQYVTYKITDGNCLIQPVIQENHVLFKVNIRGDAMIQEKQSDFDLRDQQALLVAEKAMNEQIQASVQTVIHRVQKQKIDPLALGQKLWFAYPQQWETLYQPNWRNELAKTQIDVKVDMRFTNYGLIYDNIANGGD